VTGSGVCGSIDAAMHKGDMHSHPFLMQVLLPRGY
jgi:hypothetical protein